MFHAALWDGKGLGYTAQDDRQLIDVAIGGVGVIDLGDLLVSAGSGFNSSIAAGRATIRNSFATTQGGLYIVRNDAPVAKQHQTPDPSNARVDQVFVKVYDSESGGDNSDVTQPLIVTGTPTGGATLDNRTGVGSLAGLNNYILLADVLVPNGAGSAASFTYRDRRPLATNVLPPNIKSPIVAVPMVPNPNIITGMVTFSTVNNNYQSAAAMYLPRRIANATKIRWFYQEGSTAGVGSAGNYNIGIYDASGRLIVSSGAVSLTGTAGSLQARAETITATTFEAGVYFVAFSFGTLSGGTPMFAGTMGGSIAALPVSVNTFLFAQSGGTTLPTTILGLSDIAAQTTTVTTLPVPLIALSVS